MSRLTKKLDEGFYVSNAPCTDDLKNKLGKLEDLEDELGCPLEVVFKTLKEGILVNDIKFTINGEESSKTIFREIIFTYNKFYKDYGFGFGMDENGNNPLWWISLKDCQKFW